MGFPRIYLVQREAEDSQGKGLGDTMINMTAQEIVERIMTMHWDMTACQCWICYAGRELRFGPRDAYLKHKSAVKVAAVPMIDWSPNPFRGSKAD